MNFIFLEILGLVSYIGYMSAQEQNQKKRKRPIDLNLLAASIVADATEPINPEESIEPEKNPAAVELGRLGGLKGGKARAEKLTKERRQEIARKAAQTRWGK